MVAPCSAAATLALDSIVTLSENKSLRLITSLVNFQHTEAKPAYDHQSATSCLGYSGYSLHPGTSMPVRPSGPPNSGVSYQPRPLPGKTEAVRQEAQAQLPLTAKLKLTCTDQSIHPACQRTLSREQIGHVSFRLELKPNVRWETAVP